jgi:diguanylate cyclase (GGDEF)-like protein/PAS domain S-box-containing protein
MSRQAGQTRQVLRAGVRQWQAHVMQAFALNTLRGRFLVMAAALLVLLFTLAWLVNFRVRAVSSENTANIAERQAVAAALNDITNGLWQAEAVLQRYMLVPQIEDSTLLAEVLADLIQDTQELAARPAAVTAGIAAQVRGLSADLKQLQGAAARVMAVRTDNLRLYPAMPIMLGNMQPRNLEFVAIARIAMDEAEELNAQPAQRLVYKHFAEARYNWSRMVDNFRLFVSARLGVFDSTPEAAMNAMARDLEAYAERVGIHLAQLADFERQGQLEFQQADALAKMRALHREWLHDWRQVAAIYSSERWRTDLPLMRDTIQPLFARIWESVRAIEKEMDTRSANDLTLLAQLAGRVSESLWLLALAGLLVAGLAFALFEAQIRRPIARVVAALKAEAAGEDNIVVPETRLVETQDLSRAFDHMRREVHSRQQRLQAVLDYSVEAIVTIDARGLIEGFNPAAERLFGYTAGEAIGRNVALLMAEADAGAHDGYMRRYLESGESHVLGREREEQARRKDGSVFPIALKVSEMWVDGRRLYTGMIADISERKAMFQQLESMLEQLNAREQRLHTILNNTAEGIITFDEWGTIEGFNQSAERLFGWSEMDIVGKSVAELIAAEARETRDGYLGHFMRAEIQRLIGHEGEVSGRHRKGDSFPMAIKITGMRLEGRQKYIALVSNISERKALMENLRRLAEHDGLTGLYNRSFFQAELERLVQRVQRSETANCALLYIDLDHFKYVNDTLGHAAGDKLLIEVATILNRRARKSDLVARLGGDEFTVLVYDTDPLLVDKVADSFRRHLADFAFTFEGQTVTVGCSVGVAVIEPSVASPAEIMSRADLACHLAKRAGRNQVHVFSPDDAKNVTSMSLDMGWSRRIRAAIEHNRFALACQPIVSTRTREVHTYEVLIRMQDDDGEYIMPGGFLPTAERFGLSFDIDRWVVENAIESLAAQRRAAPDLSYTINLSAQTLNSPAICDLIQERLAATGLDPAALIFEITETAAIADLAAAAALLAHLRALGCRTALDDFGSGMSSFAYLKELPVDIVKIDGRFVRHIASNAVDQAMVRAMNDIAHALGKETIAEFVENEETFEKLVELGVDYGQGYHLGRPDAIAPPVAAARGARGG